MATLEQNNYINKKYIEDELLDTKLNKNNEWFDPYIYPNEGYIPVCHQCKNDYDNFKSMAIQDNMKVEMKHPKACLWNEYFIKKIRNVCPYAKISRKNK